MCPSSGNNLNEIKFLYRINFPPFVTHFAVNRRESISRNKWINYICARVGEQLAKTVAKLFGDRLWGRRSCSRARGNFEAWKYARRSCVRARAAREQLRGIVCRLFARNLLQTLLVCAHENFGAPRQLQQNVIVANGVHRWPVDSNVHKQYIEVRNVVVSCSPNLLLYLFTYLFIHFSRVKKCPLVQKVVQL